MGKTAKQRKQKRTRLFEISDSLVLHVGVNYEKKKRNHKKENNGSDAGSGHAV